jgi:MipA family protein
MKDFHRSALLAGLVLSLTALPVRGDEAQAPLWELGVGAGVISFPDYAGSSRQNNWLLPLPYVVYRGERLQADRSGLRARLFDSERAELHLSLSANPPADQDDDGVRQGMPRTRSRLRSGPRTALAHRWRRGSATASRAAPAAALCLRHRWHADRIDRRDPVPALHYSAREWACQGCNFGISVGPVFGDADNHAYYYGVAQRYATPERQRYEADAGYAGMQLTANLSRRTGNIWIGGFLRLRGVSGAGFDDSPLVERDTNVYAGIGMAYVFARSGRLVRVRDMD